MYKQLSIKFLILSLLLISSSQLKLYGQNDLFDSLNYSLSGLSTNNKISKLKEAALIFKESSIDRAKHFANIRALLAESLQNDSLKADNLNLLGNIYFASGLNSDARNNYLESLAIYKELKDHHGCATETHNIGVVYYNENDTIKALDYFKQSKDYRQLTNDNQRIGDGLTTLGEIYLNFGYFEQSISSLTSAIEYYRDKQSYKRKYDCLAFLSDNFLMVDPDKALRWINEMKALYMLDTTNTNILPERISIRLGQYYLQKNNLSETVYHFEQAKLEEFSFEEEYFPEGTLSDLSTKLAQEGNIKQSLYFSELGRTLSRNNYSKLLKETISSYKTRLNLRTTDEELARGQELNAIVLKRLRTERIINISMLLVMLVLLIILVSMVYNLYRIRRSQKVLALRNAELRKAYNKNLKFKETTLAIKDNKNTFFNIISNKLAEPFAELNNKLFKLSEGAESSFNKNTFLKELNKSYEIAVQLEKSLKRILLWSKVQRNKYEIQAEEILVHDYMHDLLPEFLRMVVKKSIKISFDIDPELRISYDIKSLRSILKVLIENCVDNSDRDSDIIIRAGQTGKDAILSITDFGKGIPVKLQNSIYNVNSARGKKQDSENKIKLGLGLLLAKNLADLNHSKLSFESKEKKGTTFYIQIMN